MNGLPLEHTAEEEEGKSINNDNNNQQPHRKFVHLNKLICGQLI